MMGAVKRLLRRARTPRPPPPLVPTEIKTLQLQERGQKASERLRRLQLQQELMSRKFPSKETE